MSDSEEEAPQHHETEFEQANAGASETYPMQASAIRKGAYINIKDRPCKVVDVSTSKTGKHGHAKCHFVALDIFTGRKMEDLQPSTHNCDVPNVTRTDYALLDISSDGFVSLMKEDGATKDDLKLPEDDELRKQIEAFFESGKDVVITVLKAMGIEAINAVKEAAQTK